MSSKLVNLSTLGSVGDGSTVYVYCIDTAAAADHPGYKLLHTVMFAGYSTTVQMNAALAGKSDIAHTHAHSDLTGLATGDPHTQYTLLAGRNGEGQAFKNAGGTNTVVIKHSGTDDLLDLEDASGNRKNLRLGNIVGGVTVIAADNDQYSALQIQPLNQSITVSIGYAGISSTGALQFSGNGVIFDSTIGALDLRVGGIPTIYSSSVNPQHVGIATFTPLERLDVFGGNQVLTGDSSSQKRPRAMTRPLVVDNTDATRKYGAEFVAYDFNAARVCFQYWADGTNGRMAISAPNAAPTDAQLANGQISFYLDQAANKLFARVKYSDGTLKLCELPGLT